MPSTFSVLRYRINKTEKVADLMELRLWGRQKTDKCEDGVMDSEEIVERVGGWGVMGRVLD